MKSLIAGLLAALAIAGCTADQVAKAQTDLNTACIVGPVLDQADADRISATCQAAQALAPVVVPAITK